MAIPIPGYDLYLDHFTLHQLDRILPVGETQPLGEALLTLLSLECYQAGFVALTLFEQEHAPFPETPQPPDNWELPLLLRTTPVIADAFDERGNHYAARIQSGAGGSSSRTRIGSRFVHCFAPALDPAARTFSLTVVQLEKLRYDADDAPTWDAAEAVAGPFTLTFTLPGAQEVRQ